MTVTTAQRTTEISGTGGTSFSVPFPFSSADSLKVTKVLIATDIGAVLTLGTDYSVTLPSGQLPGVVTTNAAVSSSYKLRIERFTPLTQTTSFSSQGAFYPALHEAAFDKLTEAVQDAINQGPIMALQGDVTAPSSASPLTTTIAAGAVTTSKLADASVTGAKLSLMGANTFLGNASGVTGAPAAMSAAVATSLLGLFSSTLQGVVPASGGGATRYLCANGTWSVPPVTGGTFADATQLPIGVAHTTGPVQWKSTDGTQVAVEALNKAVARHLTYDQNIAMRSWTGHASADETATWSSVCWSPSLGLFVAVAAAGTNRVMTSPDGVTWTAQTAAAANAWNSVCWAPSLNLFVAVASSGTSRVMTSPNGTAWTSRTAASANAWSSVCWAPSLSLFVAVASDGVVMTSPDGINWTSRTASAANAWTAVCWSPSLSLFVAVSSSAVTNNVMTSPNGTSWTSRAAGPTVTWSSVCWSAELSLFVAGGNDVISGFGAVTTSPDGINWSVQSVETGNVLGGCCWGSEISLFVLVGSGGASPMESSPDGQTWTIRKASAANAWTSVCWSPELCKFVAVANSGTNRTMCTP